MKQLRDFLYAREQLHNEIERLSAVSRQVRWPSPIAWPRTIRRLRNTIKQSHERGYSEAIVLELEQGLELAKLLDQEIMLYMLTH